MSINSGIFLAFLALGVLAYYLCPKRVRWVVLLIWSAWFYLAYSVRAFAYLAVTVLLTYGASLWLGSLNRRQKQALASLPRAEQQGAKRAYIRRKRRILAIALVCNFATLALFKYLDSWFGNIHAVLDALHVTFRFRGLNLLLPLGISFYIFQTAGYLIDVYRGKVRPERNLLKYTLFVCYFPQMIQGPINRFDHLHHQLIEGNAFDADNLRDGIQLMIWGMLKKAFIADVLAGPVTQIYNNYAQYSGFVVFFGAVLYCLQLYCDFSGGTDLVRGASQLFGVRMAENFARPYFAQSIDEFWRRWHISLGEWMKDYLFYPLALSKGMGKLGKALRAKLGAYAGKIAAPCLSTVVVFLAVGVWQGPGWSNVAYGLWNGGLMSLAMALAPWCEAWNKRLHIRDDSRTIRVLRTARTFLLVVIGRYFSRANSLMDALRMLKRTLFHFTWNGLSAQTFFSFGLTKGSYLTLVIALCVLVYVSLRQERGADIRQSLAEKHWSVQFAVTFAAVFLLVAFVYLNTDYTAIAYVYENV